jgi:hypothetical protein
MNERSMRRKYTSKKASTKGRVDKNSQPIEMRLTYNEWVNLWQEFGQQPGFPFVLSRTDDLGHYEIGNVFIQHVVDNSTDACGLISDLDKRINEYTIRTGYKRRTVKNMIKRGDLEL